MSIRIPLYFLSRSSSSGIDSTRLFAWVSVKSEEEDLPLMRAIVDIGSPVSLIPFKIWGQAVVTRGERSSISFFEDRPECELGITHGEVTISLFDEDANRLIKDFTPNGTSRTPRPAPTPSPSPNTRGGERRTRANRLPSPSIGGGAGGGGRFRGVRLFPCGDFTLPTDLCDTSEMPFILGMHGFLKLGSLFMKDATGEAWLEFPDSVLADSPPEEQE